MNAEADKMPADRRKPNMPGGYYLSPGNQKLEQLSFRLPAPVVAKFSNVARDAGLTKRQAAELAIEILARELHPKTRRARLKRTRTTAYPHR